MIKEKLIKAYKKLESLFNKRRLVNAFKHSLTSNGNFSFNEFYLHYFKAYPNSYSFDLKTGQSVDLKNITLEMISKIFPDRKYYWQYAYGTAKSNSFIDDSDDEDVLIFDSTFNETFITVITKSVVYYLCKDKITVYHRSGIDWAIEEVKRVLSSIPMEEKEDPAAKIKLVASDGRDYYTQSSSIRATTVDTDLMYNDDFKETDKKIQNFLKSRECGIVLLHGEPGTGKTTYIRHLVTNVPMDYIYIPNIMMPHLGTPEFSSFITENRNSVFILEDCEQLLQKRDYNQFSSGISTILNMSDGLLSDICNIKFICTFNSDMGTIDDALLRPGRCYANYEFEPLAQEKVIKLAEKNNITIENPRDMTLAEIFSTEKSTEKPADKPEKKLGF